MRELCLAAFVFFRSRDDDARRCGVTSLKSLLSGSFQILDNTLDELFFSESVDIIDYDIFIGEQQEISSLISKHARQPVVN